MIQHRCLHHPGRESAARCPECRNFFCRECITEHEGRVICTPCLKRLTRPAEAKGRNFGVLLSLVHLGFGCAFAFLFFYSLGQVLLRIPSNFHDGTLWERTFMDETQPQ